MCINLESLLKSGSLWGAIQSIEDFPFFADNDPLKLDMLQVNQYGDRSVFNKMATKTIDEIADSIVLTHRNSWAKLIELNSLDINLGSTGTKKITENIDDDETRTNLKNDLNKVSAYNTDQLIVNDGMSSDSNDTLKGSKKRILTEENLNLDIAYTNLSLIQKHNIINIVLKDVSNYLTLDIY